MADKVIYMRPGETLEIRYLTHEDFERNAKSWQAQARPEKDLIKINGPHSITPATPMLECKHWKTWNAISPTQTDPAPEIAALRAEIERLREAADRIMPYLIWTIGSESPGHHPTMPSAVAHFRAAVAPRQEGTGE